MGHRKLLIRERDSQFNRKNQRTQPTSHFQNKKNLNQTRNQYQTQTQTQTQNYEKRNQLQRKNSQEKKDSAPIFMFPLLNSIDLSGEKFQFGDFDSISKSQPLKFLSFFFYSLKFFL